MSTDLPPCPVCGTHGLGPRGMDGEIICANGHELTTPKAPAASPDDVRIDPYPGPCMVKRATVRCGDCPNCNPQYHLGFVDGYDDRVAETLALRADRKERGEPETAPCGCLTRTLHADGCPEHVEGADNSWWTQGRDEADEPAKPAAPQETDTMSRLLNRATGFDVTQSPMGINITIERRGQIDGPALWAIVAMKGNVVRRDGLIEAEPLPSSRSDAFIARTRFTLEEAVEICDRYDLWNAEWKQGPGFQSSKWNYVDAQNTPKPEGEASAYEGYDDED